MWLYLTPFPGGFVSTASSTLQRIHLKDYQPAPYRITDVTLTLELDAESTQTVAVMRVERQSDTPGQPLTLTGEALVLKGVWIDDAVAEYVLDGDQLILKEVPDTFTLRIEAACSPAKNTALSGLYQSGDMLCTQCEAEGFRRIMYFLDRPDNLATYTTILRGDKTDFPVMLSNGNEQSRQDLAKNRHEIIWHDPFPKPSYLFATVAGRLSAVTDTFTTQSGEDVALVFYVRPGDESRCDYALGALKRAMAWDEQRYGLAYDLAIYHVVAVADFNMGAMENKSLNVFNTKYVFAHPEQATDKDYQNIEAVIGHEYFHNWSGNRVTCRDWFQLSLKEGLTVFREQQFSQDMGLAQAKRLDDIHMMETRQFMEDAGPMSHPIQPQSYIEINNFYTLTVYEKGAEVIRMLHTILGETGFQKGMTLYFDRHDGQAATTNDFVNAMADANECDLTSFKRWYVQAGTPVVQAEWTYQPDTQSLKVEVTQSLASTAAKTPTEPVWIPIRWELVDEKGASQSGCYVLKDKTGSWEIPTSHPNALPGLLAGFSAPVKLEATLSPAEQLHLAAHAKDAYLRTKAARQWMKHAIVENEGAIDDMAPWHHLVNMTTEKDVLARLISLPSVTGLGAELAVVDLESLIRAHKRFSEQFSKALAPWAQATYEALNKTASAELSDQAMEERSLQNATLALWLASQDPKAFAAAKKQYESAPNMTLRMGALTAVNPYPGAVREALMNDFYERYHSVDLVYQKWLSLQATGGAEGVLDVVKGIQQQDHFSMKNPNQVYSLLVAFAQNNWPGFHDKDGAGYAFIAKQIEALDALNPQVAARLANSFLVWRRFDEKRQTQAKSVLTALKETVSSTDVKEILTQALAQP